MARCTGTSIRARGRDDLWYPFDPTMATTCRSIRFEPKISTVDREKRYAYYLEYQKPRSLQTFCNYRPNDPVCVSVEIFPMYQTTPLNPSGLTRTILGIRGKICGS